MASLIIHPADIYQLGAEAVDQLACACGVRLPVAKGSNPLKDRGFVVMVGRISRRLRRVVLPTEEAVVKAAAEILDAKWNDLSAAKREMLIRAVNRELVTGVKKSAPGVDGVLKIEGAAVVGGTRRAVKLTYGFSIEGSLTERDKTTVDHVRKTHSMYVRDNGLKISESLSEKARGIVASGLERGLGNEDISEKLGKAMAGAKRPAAYWNLIANNFANRGRNYTQAYAFEEAGIERYRIVAVLDEATSAICRFMDGQTFSVKTAIKRVEAAKKLKDPEAIKTTLPWLREREGEDGASELYYEDGGGRSRRVATVTTDARGTKDDRGEFTDQMGTRGLEQAGLQLPPFHGGCRTTIVAEV